MNSNLMLKIPGLIPAFKNGKMLCRGRSITDPQKQRKMNHIVLMARAQIPAAWRKHGAGHYSMSVHFLLPDKRRRDIDGMNSTLLDCLVKAGVFPDDCWTVVPEQHQTSSLAPDGEARANVVVQFFGEQAK
jgi:Holliday junction resolvase RusA-like endonuclease